LYYLSGIVFIVPDGNAASAIGERLRDAREARFFSQAELAQNASVGQATIARIETGRQLPHPSTVRRLAQALGIEPRELVPDPAILRRPANIFDAKDALKRLQIGNLEPYPERTERLLRVAESKARYGDQQSDPKPQEE